MLDDANYIKGLDKSGALGVIAGQAAQFKHHFEPVAIQKPANIVVAGMGGSALAAEFIKCWLAGQLSVPVTITRDYNLPGFVGPNTLVIASSYSGNTEETMSAYTQAKAKQAQIVVIAAGGKLVELAKADGLPVLYLPAGMQPRMSTFYGVRALATVLEQAGLAANLLSELEATADWLAPEAAKWIQAVPQASNPAKQSAATVAGKVPVVYAGPALSFAAMKWKIDLNENAKQAAFYNYLPEMNHNEFSSWSFPKDKPLQPIELTSNLDVERISKRWAAMNQILAGQMPEPIVVKAAGKNQLQQLAWTAVLGDFISLYTAFLNGIDPTPVDLIEQLKKELI